MQADSSPLIAASKKPWVLKVMSVAYILVAVRFMVWPIIQNPVSYRNDTTLCTDLDVYVAGGRAVLEGTALYNENFPIQDMFLPFTYPPLAALMFSLLTWLPLNVLGVISILFSCAMTWLCATLIVWALQRQETDDASWKDAGRISFILTPLILCAQPFSSTLSMGQINIFLLLLVLADTLLPRTPWPRGLLIGLAAAIKLTPAVFGLLFLLQKRWREALTTALSGLGVTALAWLILPRDSLQYWTSTLFQPSRIGGLAYSSNQSILGFLARITGNHPSSTVWFFLMLITVGVVSRVILTALRHGALVTAVGANGLLALLCSPVSWSHHWVLLLPLIMSMLWPCLSLWRHTPRPYLTPEFLLSALGVVLTYLLPFHLLFPHENNLELKWSPPMHILGSEYLFFGILWLLVIWVRPATIMPLRQRSAALVQRRVAPH